MCSSDLTGSFIRLEGPTVEIRPCRSWRLRRRRLERNDRGQREDIFVTIVDVGVELLVPYSSCHLIVLRRMMALDRTSVV